MTISRWDGGDTRNSSLRPGRPFQFRAFMIPSLKICRSCGACGRWLLTQENSTPNLSVLQQTFISHLRVSGPAVARSGSMLGLELMEQLLAGCVIHTQGQKLKSTCKASVPMWEPSYLLSLCSRPGQALYPFNSLHLIHSRCQPFPC